MTKENINQNRAIDDNPRDSSSSRVLGTPQNDTPKKILIIHDRFQFRGGAERLILILAEALKADLLTEFWETNSFPKEDFKGKNLYILDKGEAPQIVWRYFRAHFNYLFKTRKIIRQYDLVIFSGNNCLTAAVHCRRGVRKILYCHSPVRHVFDLKQKCRAEQRKLWKRIIYYDIGSWGIRLIYWLGLKMMDYTIVNSENIKKRLWNFSHHQTDKVIYPPIDTDKFKWLGQEDFYLSFGRVERLKRITDVVTAFQKMPDKKLVVVSGGPELEKIKNLAAGYNNIKIVGWVSDGELADYLGRCLATIYIPIDEDFGMTSVESMSAGKPCLGVAEGGLLETILDDQTGKLVPAKYTIDEIVSAINWLTPEKCLAMRQDCEARAQKFSKESFIAEMKEIINTKKKIKIGIDASRSIETLQKTGVEKVSDELIKEIEKYGNKEIKGNRKNFIYYTPQEIPWLPKENQRVLTWPFKYLWTQLRLGWEILVNPPQIFFSPVYALPFVSFFIHSIKYYKIIHDIAFKKHPEFYSWQQKVSLHLDLWLAKKVCIKIFVPTQAVKDDLEKYCGLGEKVIVIPHGYSRGCHSEADKYRLRNPVDSTRDPSLAKCGVGMTFHKKQILYIGRIEEKKNIANLIKAFQIFNQQYSDYKLILAGPADKKFIAGYKNIEMPGYVTGEQKEKFLRESECLVLVSKEEGFGFPALEGWNYDLPVLVSDIPTLREVGGEACVYVKPESPEDIANGLEKITQDENLRKELINKGSERLKNFDWQKIVEKYWAEIL